jgi:hypothetical protein
LELGDGRQVNAEFLAGVGGVSLQEGDGDEVHLVGGGGIGMIIGGESGIARKVRHRRSAGMPLDTDQGQAEEKEDGEQDAHALSIPHKSQV